MATVSRAIIGEDGEAMSERSGMTLLHCLPDSSDLVPSKALEIRAGVTESVPAAVSMVRPMDDGNSLG
jgi:hypothetical protein